MTLREKYKESNELQADPPSVFTPPSSAADKFLNILLKFPHHVITYPAVNGPRMNSSGDLSEIALNPEER